MLVNLAASHTDVVSESKKKAEAVLAAPTKKQAGSLARVEGGGGISCFPDNVAGMGAPPRGEPSPRGGGGSPPRPALWGGHSEGKSLFWRKE